MNSSIRWRPHPVSVPAAPPNGWKVSQKSVESLTMTVPLRIRSAYQNALLRSLVNTAACSPRWVRLAMPTAASSSAAVRIGTTGPNDSSRETAASFGDPIDHSQLVVEIGRVSTRPAATDENLAATLDGILDVPIHLGGGGLVVERAHGGVVGERVAESHQSGRFQSRFDEGIVDLVDHDHPLGGGAHLAGVVVGAVHRGRGGGLDVGIAGDDQRSIARHLHDRPLEPHRRDDPLAGLG